VRFVGVDAEKEAFEPRLLPRDPWLGRRRAGRCLVDDALLGSGDQQRAVRDDRNALWKDASIRNIYERRRICERPLRSTLLWCSNTTQVRRSSHREWVTISFNQAARLFSPRCDKTIRGLTA
jgi:hypothetical protein